MVSVLRYQLIQKNFDKNRGQFNLIFSQDVSKIVQFLLGEGGGKFKFTSSSIVRYDIIFSPLTLQTLRFKFSFEWELIQLPGNDTLQVNFKYVQ